MIGIGFYKKTYFETFGVLAVNLSNAGTERISFVFYYSTFVLFLYIFKNTGMITQAELDDLGSVWLNMRDCSKE